MEEELTDGKEPEPCNDFDVHDDEDDVEDREEDGVEAWFFPVALKMELKMIDFMLFFCIDFDLNDE